MKISTNVNKYNKLYKSNIVYATNLVYNTYFNLYYNYN